jgi:hypothetical protein
VTENIYASVLRQLARMESSTQAVATLLHVPENTLMRWMDGRARMPLRAFMLALELVADREGSAGPLPFEGRGERLVFKAGPELAHCAKCGGEEFRRADPSAPHTYRSMLACLRCGSEVIHGNLIAELARQVSLRAGSYVERARSRARGKRVSQQS